MDGRNLSAVFGPNVDHKIPEFIHRIFEKNANGTRAAIYNDNRNEVKLDFETLNATANRIAKFLLEKTLNSEANQDGDYLIGVSMQPSVELIVTILAILKMGAAYVPIEVAYRDQVKHILNEAKPMCVICDNLAIKSGLFDECTAALRYRDCFDASRSLNGDNIPNERCFDSGNAGIALVLYTSGSTGMPKGVRIPHSALLNRVMWQYQSFPYAATETIGVFKTIFSFIDATIEIWSALLGGRSLLVLPNAVNRDPSALVHLLDLYQIQRLVLVPSMLRSIVTYLNLDGQAGKLPNMKLFTCTSETLSKQLVDDFFSYFSDGAHTLTNFYGTTEVMGDVTYFICDSNDKSISSIPIGTPIDNTACYVLTTDTMQLAAIDDIGELYISGDSLARGYVNGREMDRFCVNPFSIDARHHRLYRTGDLARLGRDGQIHYEGRMDAQVKIRGHRVELGPIELQLSRIENVKQAVVFAIKSDQHKIIANVIVDHERRLTGADIEYVLRTKLPDYMIPEVVVVAEIPLLHNGKTDWQLLLKHYQNIDVDKGTSIDYAGVAHASMEKAKALFETIAEITAHFSSRSISLDSNFYEIGGNSLNSLYVIAKLRETNYGIDISDFITSKSLAAVIQKMCALDCAVDRNVSFGEIERKLGLRSEMLAEKHRLEAAHVVASSFFYKSDLDKYLVEPATLTDYIETILAIWRPLVDAGLSFVVLDRDEKIVGASLNFEAHSTPDVPLIGGVGPLIEILKENEFEFLHSLPTDRPIVNTFLMGALNVSPSRNVGAMAFMEKEATRLAIQKGCGGILTTNISPVTKSLCKNVNGYRIVRELQANTYVLNGERPYASAPDSYTITSEWKQL